MKQIKIPFGHFLLCLVALFPLTQAAAQGFELVFEKSPVAPGIGQVGYDIIETSDGNLLVLTNELGTNGQILKKLDPNGNVIWQDALSANTSLQAAALVENAPGQIIVVGDAAVPGQPNQRAVYWQVRSASGAFISEHSYHDGMSHFKSSGAVLSPNGHIVLAAQKNFDMAGMTPEMAILEVNTAGTVGWVQSWPTANSFISGNVTFLANGLGVAGFFDPGSGNLALQRFEFTGNLLSQVVLPFTTDGISDLEPGIGAGLFVGAYSVAGGDCIFKLDNDLQQAWSMAPMGTFGQLIQAELAATSDGGCAATGYTIGQFLQLFKITAAGSQEWAVIWDNPPFASGADGAAITQTSNGGFALCGQVFDNNNYVIATDALGQVGTHIVTGRILIDFNGNCVQDAGDFPYSVALTLSNPTDLYNFSSNSLGNFSVTVDVGTYDLMLAPGQVLQLCQPLSIDANQPSGSTNLGDLLLAPDAFYTLSGTVFYNSENTALCAFDPNEQPVPDKPVLLGILPNTYLRDTTDANGHYSFQVPGGFDFFLITDSIDHCNNCNMASGTVSQDLVFDIGVTCTGALEGRVFNDADTNCQFDAGEQGLVGWQVAAVRQNTADTIFISTNSIGAYYQFVAYGTYEVFVLPPNNLWAACAGPFLLDVTNGPDAAYTEFPMQAQAFCPRLRVDLGTNVLRPCQQSHYTVKYCNDGTDGAAAAYVEVALDPLLLLTGSQWPAIGLGNNTYRFDLGNVPQGFCGEFWFNANLSCQAPMGATHCVEAHIFPDSTCAPLDPIWDGSSIELQALCENGEVKFTISNSGLGNMAGPLPYLVIEDNVLLRPGETMLFQLTAGADTTIVLPATGNTFRLETQQSPGHPSGGSLTAAWLEGCGTTGNAPIEVSYVTQYPFGDEEPFLAIDCRQNVFSYDPNDKLAFPQGIGNQRFIQENTELDYQVRFQNTGTAAALDVVLRDTLSPFLDPATLRPGASSHPYHFVLENGNVAVFTFPAINLPPLSAGEEASQGWVKFRIGQTPGNQPGTLIENLAAIYFDQNPPIITPPVFHQIPHPQTIISTQLSLCGGEAWQGQVFENDTTLSEALHYAFFDSIFVTEIDVLPAANSVVSETLCLGGSLEVGGTVFDESNPAGTVVLSTVNGCDSTVVVALGFYPAAAATISGPLCEDESIVVNGNLYFLENPQGTEILPNAATNGCDSIVYVDLDILFNQFSTFDTTLLPGTEWQGAVYWADTVFTQVFFASNGCDSLVAVTIDVLVNGLEEGGRRLPSFNIYPNPLGGEWAFLEIHLPENTALSVQLYDGLGRAVPVLLGAQETVAGKHLIPLDMTGKVPGIYHLVISHPQGRKVLKLVRG